MSEDAPQAERHLEIEQKCGVINPYTLAELITGRRLNWSTIRDVPGLLEDVFQTPFDELFDPAHGGPLYTGLELDRNLDLQRVRSPLLDVTVPSHSTDLEIPFDAAGRIRTLADLGPMFDTEDVGAIPVIRAKPRPGGEITVTVRPPTRRGEWLAQVLTPEIVRTISFDPELTVNDGWTPPMGTWDGGGDFFNEAAEFFDPTQGNVANCYFLAALGAVAWATPFRISHVTRATGAAQPRYVDRIQFFRPDSGGTVDREFEVTEDLVRDASASLIYARSSESGEIWPAVYEKAFACLETNTTNDHPDILATAWGDCVWATAQLTGGRRSSWSTSGRTGDQMWDLVRQHSQSRRTVNPMVAWTYSTGEASEKKVVYDVNVVASHCYTVLGWDYRNGTKYIVLRNVWGHTEPTVGVLPGAYTAFDMSWWRPVVLAPNDGTFGIEAGAFQTYFAGLGVTT